MADDRAFTELVQGIFLDYQKSPFKDKLTLAEFASLQIQSDQASMLADIADALAGEEAHEEQAAS